MTRPTNPRRPFAKGDIVCHRIGGATFRVVGVKNDAFLGQNLDHDPGMWGHEGWWFESRKYEINPSA